MLSSLDSFQIIPHVSILYYQYICVKHLTIFSIEIKFLPEKMKHKLFYTFNVGFTSLFTPKHMSLVGFKA
jgi:hypothetical protein